MEIKKLYDLSIEELNSLGIFGYTSNQKYEVTKEETMQTFSLQMNLINLDKPYIKQELNDDDELDRYQKLVKLGYSLGLYLDNKLAAIAIAEPQLWNNTLLLWHFQVHENHRRKSYGSILMNNMIDLAKENGFRAVTLETQNTNAPAIHFYKQCGFMIEGVDLSFYTNLDNGNEEIALFMRKKLDEE